MSAHDAAAEAEAALTPRKKPSVIPVKRMVSTGCTPLNLAISGKSNGGFEKGKYYFLVGDSGSGKSFETNTILAEANINKNFDDYRFIYDDPENGVGMDRASFFGASCAERVELPGEDDDGNPCSSRTVTDFYANVHRAVQEGKPFIYILDSMDGLYDEESDKKFIEQVNAKKKGKKVAGTYDTGKPKINSTRMPKVISDLKAMDSILIVVCQTRDNIGFDAMFNPKTRAGGHALKFYASLEIWTSVVGSIKKTVRGKPRKIGIMVRAKVKKNRQTGRDRQVDFPIYYSHGVDDVGACVKYLLEEEHWTDTKGKIKAPEFEFEGTEEKLIRHIEENDLEAELRSLVTTVWNEIDEATLVHRKTRYE